MTKTELRNLKKQDLIDLIEEAWPSYKPIDSKKWKKDKLVTLYIKLQNEEVGNINLDEILSEQDNSGTIDLEETSIIPFFNSPEWTEYVIGQFTADELVGGEKPTCDGLRRVFELLIGDIYESRLDIIRAPSIHDRDTTVTWYIRYMEYRTGHEKSITEGFNVNPENTKFPWNLAAVATAATRAEARALRKGLRLQKVLSQEEIAHGFDVDDLPDDNKAIASNQKVAIRSMSGRLGIRLEALLKSLSLPDQLDQLTFSDGHEVLDQLNKYQRGSDQGGESIPNNLISGQTELSL